MANVSAIATTTTAATALSNLILVSPQSTVGYQPKNPANSTAAQPPALLFQYEGENKVSIRSDVTDHYIEDNTAVADQIALAPEIVSVHGFIGELTNAPPNSVLAAAQTVANKLSIVSAYLPALSTTALLAYNEAFEAYQVAANAVNSAVSSYNALGNQVFGSSGQNVIDGNTPSFFNPTTGKISGVQNKQQVAFQQFYGYWRNRTLFTIQTPWAVFDNMVIMSLDAIQDEKTNVITDFQVTFKLLRFAETTSSFGASPSQQGRAIQQSAPTTNLGTSNLGPSASFSDSLARMGVA